MEERLGGDKRYCGRIASGGTREAREEMRKEEENL